MCIALRSLEFFCVQEVTLSWSETVLSTLNHCLLGYVISLLSIESGRTHNIPVHLTSYTPLKMIALMHHLVFVNFRLNLHYIFLSIKVVIPENVSLMTLLELNNICNSQRCPFQKIVSFVCILIFYIVLHPGVMSGGLMGRRKNS